MSSVPSLRRLLAVSALVVTFSVSACGTDSPSSEESDAPSPTPTASLEAEGPSCASVWVDGAGLPRDYDGCVDGESFVTKDALGCSSGQTMVRFDDHYYAVLGGTISQTDAVLDDDNGYRDAVASCRG